MISRWSLSYATAEPNLVYRVGIERRPGRRCGSQRVAAHFALRKGASVNSANFDQLRNSEKSRWPSGRVQGETSEKKLRPGADREAGRREDDAPLHIHIHTHMHLLCVQRNTGNLFSQVGSCVTSRRLQKRRDSSSPPPPSVRCNTQHLHTILISCPSISWARVSPLYRVSWIN